MNIKNPHKLIQNIIDVQENFIVIIEEAKPILMNTAFCDFFGVSSFEQYQNEFGDFDNNFVPHPNYFHKEKLLEGETWIQGLLKLSEKDRVVSMLNTSYEPRAFKVNIDNSHPDYAIVSLKGISADLIKSIMIENDVSIDKKSGAYNKDYFLHTSEILQDGARYNEKNIGITMMNILDECDLSRVVQSLNGVSRQNDMLVKYSKSVLLMAYLVETDENALSFSKKLQIVLNLHTKNKMIVSLLKDKAKITTSVKSLQANFDSIDEGELKVI